MKCFQENIINLLYSKFKITLINQQNRKSVYSQILRIKTQGVGGNFNPELRKTKSIVKIVGK